MEDSRVVNTPVLDTALRGVTPDRKGRVRPDPWPCLIPEADGSGIARPDPALPHLAPHFWRSASPGRICGGWPG